MEPDFYRKTILGQKWRTSVKNMRFRAFLCNQSLDSSDFWYKTSLIYYFEYAIGSFAKKKIVGQKWLKGVKNMRFQAFLGNQPLDFSDF